VISCYRVGLYIIIPQRSQRYKTVYHIIYCYCSSKPLDSKVYVRHETLFSGTGYRLYNDIRFLMVPWTSLQTICMPYVYILLFSTKITDCYNIIVTVSGGGLMYTNTQKRLVESIFPWIHSSVTPEIN